MVPAETSQRQPKVRRTKIRVRNTGTANKRIRSIFSGRIAIATNEQRLTPDVGSKLCDQPVSSYNQGTIGTTHKIPEQTGPKDDITKQQTMKNS